MAKKDTIIDEKKEDKPQETAPVAFVRPVNIYQRLQLARAMFKAIEIKETGNNKYAEYTYLELKDFLPHVTVICEKVGLCPIVTFETDWVFLTFHNVDNPAETIVFNSPNSSATLKGCHPVQNLGAVQSYIRRYLYINAFEVCETDALDNTTGKDKVETVVDNPLTKRQEPVKAAPGKVNGAQAAQQAAQRTPPPPPASQAEPLPPGESDSGFADFETIEQHDERYFERIRLALEILFNDNVFKKKALITELTTFTRATDNVVITGNPDYRNKTGKPLEYLCHEIERLAKKHTADAVQNFRPEREPGEEG